MTTSDWITIIGIAIGLFVTTIGSSFVLIFKMGALHQKVESMAKTIEDMGKLFDRRLASLEYRVDQLSYTVAQLVVKVDVLWKIHISNSNSPIVLNEVGLRALESSNIGAFAEHHYSEILLKVMEAHPRNAYQAQEALISVVSDYQTVEGYLLKLQEVAFNSGQDVNSLLFVAALTIRDRVILDLGFTNGTP